MIDLVPVGLFTSLCEAATIWDDWADLGSLKMFLQAEEKQGRFAPLGPLKDL